MVEWDYLISVFGFGPTFCTWIIILQSAPTASFHINYVTSSYFSSPKRDKTRLMLISLFSFDFAIEPIAIALHSDKRIGKVTRREIIHKMSLYADDLLLHILNPENSIPHLLEVFKEFGKLSGYKLTLTKSLHFPMNKGYDQFPFKIELKCFAYLGIHVICTFAALLKHNFTPITRPHQDRLSELFL